MVARKILAMLVLCFCVGCRIGKTGSEFSADIQTKKGLDGIGLFQTHYVGLFKDTLPTLSGRSYRDHELSVIAHLPTKSEFFIYVAHPKDEDVGSGVTNICISFVDSISTKAGATDRSDTWQTIGQRVSNRKNTNRREVAYLKSEFVGSRCYTDRYSKSDRVEIVTYAGCLTPERPASRAVYSVAFAIVPIETAKDERERLFQMLRNFLENGITYYP